MLPVFAEYLFQMKLISLDVLLTNTEQMELSQFLEPSNLSIGWKIYDADKSAYLADFLEAAAAAPLLLLLLLFINIRGEMWTSMRMTGQLSSCGLRLAFSNIAFGRLSERSILRIAFIRRHRRLNELSFGSVAVYAK